jgi:hypothetical protein
VTTAMVMVLDSDAGNLDDADDVWCGSFDGVMSDCGKE